jgi:hypothetical protein
MRALAFLFILSSAACTTDVDFLDRLATSDFGRTGPDSFTYTGAATIWQPEDSKAGERARMNTLRTWLKKYNMCARGYSISKRTPIEIRKVRYEGTCKP